MKKIVYITTILFVSTYCCAQDFVPKDDYLAISVGSFHTSLQDLVFSPLVYRGNGLVSSVDYVKSNTKTIHNVSLSYGRQLMSPIKTENLSTSVEHFLLNADYELLKTVGGTNNQFSIGGGFYNFISIRSFQFRYKDEFSFDLSSSLNLVGAYHKQIGQKHRLTAAISYPVLSYVVGRMRVPLDFPDEVIRPILDDPDDIAVSKLLTSGELLTVNDYIDFRTRIRYQYLLSNSFSLGACYQFRYIQYPKFKLVKHGQSHFKLELSYLW